MTSEVGAPAAEERSAANPRRSVLAAAALVLVGSLGIQTSSAVSAGLFDAHGPLGTSALRMGIAAIVLLVLLRPSLRGRGRAEWTGIVVYGAAMAAMNVCLYEAIDRLPLGVAVTLDFLGPCAVALLGSRRFAEGLCAVVALLGVALISIGPWGYFDAVGYAFGLGAAAFFGVYTVFAARVGKASGTGLDGMALSVTVAAILTSPFALTQVSSTTGTQWAWLAVSAVIGVAIPYSVDTLAGRITSARVIGSLFAIDPAMGSIVGLILLHERIAPPAVAGILLVAVSGALLVWFGSGRGARPIRASRRLRRRGRPRP